MLLSAVSVLAVAQSTSEIPEGLMNNPVYKHWGFFMGYSNRGVKFATILHIVLRKVSVTVLPHPLYAFTE